MLTNTIKRSIIMQRAFSTSNMLPFPLILTAGGDDRLVLNPKT